MLAATPQISKSDQPHSRQSSGPRSLLTLLYVYGYDFDPVTQYSLQHL